MSVIFRTVERPSDPRVENSPKKYYPQLVTLGQSVDLAFIAQKMQDRSSLSIGDIKSTMQNFVEKLKEQLLEGKTVNIAGLGVFILAAKSKGEEKADDVTAKSVESVRICFQANRELKISKAATRAGERLDLVSLDDYLKGRLLQMAAPVRKEEVRIRMETKVRIHWDNSSYELLIR